LPKPSREEADVATSIQVTFDAGDPQALGGFWAAALGYIEQPPPEGFESWEAFLDSMAVPADQRDKAYAIVDPDGGGPRLFFQKVPEGKSAKNRVHLDVNVGRGDVDARAEQLKSLGATEVRRVEEMGEYWIVMQDPEGNEFCLQ